MQTLPTSHPSPRRPQKTTNTSRASSLCCCIKSRLNCFALPQTREWHVMRFCGFLVILNLSAKLFSTGCTSQNMPPVYFLLLKTSNFLIKVPLVPGTLWKQQATTTASSCCSNNSSAEGEEQYLNPSWLPQPSRPSGPRLSSEVPGGMIRTRSTSKYVISRLTKQLVQRTQNIYFEVLCTTARSKSKLQKLQKITCERLYTRSHVVNRRWLVDGRRGCTRSNHRLVIVIFNHCFNLVSVRISYPTTLIARAGACLFFRAAWVDDTSSSFSFVRLTLALMVCMYVICNTHTCLVCTGYIFSSQKWVPVAYHISRKLRNNNVAMLQL